LKKIVAIHPDKVETDGGFQSFSMKWLDALSSSSSIETREVNVFSPDFVADLRDADAFMWRTSNPGHFETLRRIMPAINRGLAIPTFPPSNLALLVHDKIAQSYLFQTHNLPFPKTEAFFNYDLAMEHIETHTYPKVVKFIGGSSSDGVGLVRDRDEAARYVRAMFGPGLQSMGELNETSFRLALKKVRNGLQDIAGSSAARRPKIQHGYAYFQDFIPDNTNDIRITVIGQYALGFRRFNRPDDFRASGSGLLDWDPTKVPNSAVSLAFRVSKELNLPFVAVDVLYDGNAAIICELNFAYRAWAVDRCPGYWLLNEDNDLDPLSWVDTQVDCAALTLHEFIRINLS